MRIMYDVCKADRHKCVLPVISKNTSCVICKDISYDTLPQAFIIMSRVTMWLYDSESDRYTICGSHGNRVMSSVTMWLSLYCMILLVHKSYGSESDRESTSIVLYSRECSHGNCVMSEWSHSPLWYCMECVAMVTMCSHGSCVLSGWRSC